MRARFKRNQIVKIHTQHLESLNGALAKVVEIKRPMTNDAEIQYVVSITSYMRFLESELVKDKGAK